MKIKWSNFWKTEAEEKIEGSSYKTSFERSLQALSAKTPLVVEVPGRSPLSEELLGEYIHRRPFIYDAMANQIHLGQSGGFHNNITDALGWPVGIESRAKHLYPGMVWTNHNTVDHYGEPPNYDHIVQALSNHLGTNLQKQDPDEYGKDEFWQ